MIGNFLDKLTIKSRLISMLMFISVCSVLLCLSITTFLGVQSISQETKVDLALNAQLLGSRNAAALAFGNAELSRQSLQLLNEQKNIITGCILDKEGGLFATYNTAPHLSDCTVFAKDWRGFYEETEVANLNTVQVVRNIYSEGEWVGGVILISSQQKIYSYLSNQITSATVIILIVIAASFFIANFLQRFVSKPIMDMVVVTEQISQHPSTAYTPLYQHNDEFNRVLKSFSTIIRYAEEKYKYCEGQSKQYAEALKATNQSFKLLLTALRSVEGTTEAVSELVTVKPMGNNIENYESYIQDIKLSLAKYKYCLESVSSIADEYQLSLPEEKQPISILESLSARISKLHYNEVVGKCEIVLDERIATFPNHPVFLLSQRAWDKTNQIIFELIPILLANNDKKSILNISYKEGKESDELTFEIHPMEVSLEKPYSNNIRQLINSIKEQKERQEDYSDFFSDELLNKTDFDFIFECAKYIANVNGIILTSIIEYPFCIISYQLPHVAKLDTLLANNRSNVLAN